MCGEIISELSMHTALTKNTTKKYETSCSYKLLYLEHIPSISQILEKRRTHQFKKESQLTLSECPSAHNSEKTESSR